MRTHGLMHGSRQRGGTGGAGGAYGLRGGRGRRHGCILGRRRGGGVSRDSCLGLTRVNRKTR
jgi:hypothetical protein